MATTISQIETYARQHLQEATARFWSSAELTDIIIRGIKDLWRDIVDLKEEDFLEFATLTLQANSSTMIGVPEDIHKVYLLEPSDISENSANRNVIFKPMDYNHVHFQNARTRTAVEPSNVTIYYAVTGTGGPVGAPSIRVAPQVNTQMSVTLAYVPTLPALAAHSKVPIRGEADNALIAWCVAFARAKENEDKAPDAGWLIVYRTEKEHLLQSLGVRNLQEPKFVDALFEEFW